MNVLVVTPYLPHPRAGNGTGVFLYGLLSRLALRHRVTLVSFCDEREAALAHDLRTLPITTHLVPRAKGRGSGSAVMIGLALLRMCQFALSVAFWEPYYVGKYRSRRMARLIGEITAREHFDIVQFEFAFMGQYGKYVRSGKTVLHEHDVAFRPAYRRFRKASSLFSRAAMYLEWCRWARYEPAIARRFDHVLTVTEQDTSLLRRLSGANHISYLPRGVDVPDRMPDPHLRDARSLLFVGTFAHHPNLDAARWLVSEIFPLVAALWPDATLSLVGPHPPDDLKALAGRFPGVSVLGYVDDVLPHLRKASAFVAPLRHGGGVKLKIIQAMANGIPVVTTNVGIEGIQGIGPGSVLLGSTPHSFADQVDRLFRDASLPAALATAGYAIAKKFYSWDSTVSRVEEVYSLIPRGKEASAGRA